jgi:hypothetical protein
MTTKTFPLTAPINLQARLGHGSLTINARDDLSEARVEITSDEGDSPMLERITVEMQGKTLSIQAPRQGGIFDLPLFNGPFGGGRGNRDAVDVVVTVPSTTAMKISTFTADVTVHGRSGGVDIGSGSTRVELDQVDGDLRLRFGHGSAVVAQVSGSVEFRSGSGDLTLGEIGGALSSASGNGRLEVASVQGAVRARTGAGSASIGAVHDNVDLLSGSGRLDIGIPAGRSAHLDVTTGSGSVSSEFEVASAPVRDGRKAISVRARTGSGDIRLFRAA